MTRAVNISQTDELSEVLPLELWKEVFAYSPYFEPSRTSDLPTVSSTVDIAHLQALGVLGHTGGGSLIPREPTVPEKFYPGVIYLVEKYASCLESFNAHCSDIEQIKLAKLRETLRNDDIYAKYCLYRNNLPNDKVNEPIAANDNALLEKCPGINTEQIAAIQSFLKELEGEIKAVPNPILVTFATCQTYLSTVFWPHSAPLAIHVDLGNILKNLIHSRVEVHHFIRNILANRAKIAALMLESVEEARLTNRAYAEKQSFCCRCYQLFYTSINLVSFFGLPAVLWLLIRALNNAPSGTTPSSLSVNYDGRNCSTVACDNPAPTRFPEAFSPFGDVSGLCKELLCKYNQDLNHAYRNVSLNVVNGSELYATCPDLRDNNGLYFLIGFTAAAVFGFCAMIHLCFILLDMYHLRNLRKDPKIPASSNMLAFFRDAVKHPISKTPPTNDTEETHLLQP